MQAAKIKVLQVHDKYEVGGGVGGSVRYFSTVFPKLSDNYQVTVCSLSREDKGSQLLRERGFKVLCIPKGKLDLTKVFDLLRIIKSEQIDILHSHAFSSANFVALRLFFPASRLLFSNISAIRYLYINALLMLCLARSP